MKNTWESLLKPEYEQPYFLQLKGFLREEAKQGQVIYPAKENLLNAFRLTPFDQTKVVIIGQDPYHGPKQAHGLAFSVQDGVKVPPSLQNVYKEIQEDIGITMPAKGDLTAWAKQGVLLLNTCLSVREGQAHSHANKGWEVFTDKAIRLMSDKSEHPVIFVLWGSPARKKAALIDKQRHHILEAAHPSPLSAYRGFFGCKHFSKINEILENAGQAPINWQL